MEKKVPTAERSLDRSIGWLGGGKGGGRATQLHLRGANTLSPRTFSTRDRWCWDTRTTLCLCVRWGTLAAAEEGKGRALPWCRCLLCRRAVREAAPRSGMDHVEMKHETTAGDGPTDGGAAGRTDGRRRRRPRGKEVGCCVGERQSGRKELQDAKRGKLRQGPQGAGQGAGQVAATKTD